MCVKKITNIEGLLLNVIETIGTTEWRRYRQRYPIAWVGDHFEKIDGSNWPPFIAFRFENESKKVIEKLKKLIDNYHGAIKWELHEHKRDRLPGANWVIRPLKMCEVESLSNELGLSSGEYLAQYEPDFGPIAFDDLNNLTQYIKNNI